MRIFITYTLLILASIVELSASDSIPLISQQRIGFSLEGSYAPSSIRDELRYNKPFEPTINVHGAYYAKLQYSFTFGKKSIAYYYPGGYQGIGLGMANFGFKKSPEGFAPSHYIGNPLLLYVFQGAPIVRLAYNLFLLYEWQFGASFGWKPYSPENEDFNLNVGSRVNAFLNLGFLIRWNISKRVFLDGGISFSHFSNGNTSWPNPGVNSVGGRIGIGYYITDEGLSQKREKEMDSAPEKRMHYDISLWGASRKRVYKGLEVPILLKGHFACAGISFSPLYNVNKWISVGGALDFQWDESSDLQANYATGTTPSDIKFYRPSLIDQTALGLSAHGEVRMPVFALNIGIGVNLLAPMENRGTYQNITLKTYLFKGLYLNVGYQLRNFAQQSNLMLGVGYSL